MALEYNDYCLWCIDAVSVLKRDHFQALWDAGNITTLYAIREAPDDWRLFYRHNDRLWCYRAKEAEATLEPPFGRCVSEPTIVSTITQHKTGKSLTYIRDSEKACRFLLNR